MRPGIFAKTFAGDSLEVSLRAVHEHGLEAIQFNLALAGGPSLPTELPDALAARIATAVRANGLDMVAVSGTYNMAHPDPDVRRHGLDALALLIEAAPALGTRVITLCTGSRDPQDMWRWHPENSSPEAWHDMLSSIADAIGIAEEHNVLLAFEPEHNNVVSNAQAGRKLLDETASAHLKVVIDAANLILPGELDRQAQTLERAFDLLGPDIVLAHAKDVRDDGTIVPAGRGGLDYVRYISLLRRVGYEGAVVLHGLRRADVHASVGFLSGLLEEAVTEAA